MEEKSSIIFTIMAGVLSLFCFIFQKIKKWLIDRAFFRCLIQAQLYWIYLQTSVKIKNIECVFENITTNITKQEKKYSLTLNFIDFRLY